MFKNKKKILALTTAVLILVMSLGTTSFAASTLTAQFKALKIQLNGSQVTMESQPIIVNGSTYLPLRFFANLFKKNVDWNATLQQISITDQPDNEVASLKAQIAEKDNQILILQAQLTAKSGDRSLSDMEDQLNDDYEDYEDLDVDVTLSGTKSKITVKIDVASKSKWNALSTTKKTKLLQYISDDLDDEYDDPSISGTVKAGSTTISTFTVNSSGTVKIGSSSDLSDLEDDLNDTYNKISTLSISSIELDGDEDEVTFTVNINYSGSSTNTSKWDALSSSTIKNFMAQIKSEILDEYEDAEVEGYVYDTNDNENMAKYYESSGSFTLRRYLP